MRMDPNDAQKYPKTIQFLTTIERRVKLQPTVLNAFYEACEADEQNNDLKVARSFAEKALRWGAEPLISVYPGMIEVEKGSAACGYMNTLGVPLGKKAHIDITSFYFDAFEFGFDVDPNRAGNRLMKTVLHELVHWVRDQAQASDRVLDGGHFRGRWVEAGEFFEEKAYGQSRVLCTDDEIWAAIFSRRT
jgi:hypothetical protein